tara:strand:+ start:187 stop:795 length:609 start_codon:yes stop_codon:yes gene_type:complete
LTKAPGDDALLSLSFPPEIYTLAREKERFSKPVFFVGEQAKGLFIVRFHHRSHFFQFERETNDFFCGGLIIEREEEETEDVETNDPCTKHHDRPHAPRYDGRRRKQHRWWRIPEFYRRRAATLSLKCWCWRRRRRRRLEVVLGAVDRVPDEIHVALRGENGAPVRLVYELAGNGTHGARNPNAEREPSVFGGVQLTVWVPPV